MFTNTHLICRRNGAGGLDISVEGPSDSMVSYTEKQDGHYDIQYVPSMPGVYDINITSGGKHILGKLPPFTQYDGLKNNMFSYFKCHNVHS